MKVIQSVVRYFPDNCGGIQVNLNDVIPLLSKFGIDSDVIAPGSGKQDQTYDHNGVSVYRYPVPKEWKQVDNSPPAGIDYFKRWLTSKQADVYHQHHWSSRCGLEHLRIAKALGLATVITIHDPGPICQRGTLMLGGQTTCDGNIDYTRCSRCCGVPAMLPGGFVEAISRLPQPLINRIELPPSAQIWANPIQSPHPGMKAIAGALMRSLVVPNYIAQRQQKLWQMFEVADRIIAVCQWLYDALLINGIPKEKLILSRCGVSETLQAPPHPSRSPLDPLKLVYLGRWDPNKGIHILVEAIQQLPTEVPVELTIYGIKQGATYRQQIVQQVADDARFRIEQPLSRADIAKILPQFDALVVPSQWLEAGPLVVLEAHALGIPVIGSNLGGIAELVKHGKNGWLVDPQDVAGWTQAIATLAQNRALLDSLRDGIQSVRTVRQQADDLAEIYQQLAVRENSTKFS